MHVVPTPDPNDPAQPVINAVVAHVLRWGRAPRVLLAVSEIGDSAEISRALTAELRRRELDVVVATHAREMHAALRAHFVDPERSLELLVAMSDLPGCAPYHALAWARRSGFTAPAIVSASPMDAIAYREASEVAFDVVPKSLLLPSIDRTLLRSLRRIWSERPSVAA